MEYAKGETDFDDWWTRGCIPGHNRARHSCKWLIIQMVNKVGGAHVDPNVTPGYKELATDVSVRQIAWELLESLRRAEF